MKNLKRTIQNSNCSNLCPDCTVVEILPHFPFSIVRFRFFIVDSFPRERSRHPAVVLERE